MLTRRQLAALGATVLTEAALAQRAAVTGPIPPGTIWLNANENPDGPPKASLEAMMKVLPMAGRYHYQQFRPFYSTLAASEGLDASQILVGAGSSEVLQCAIHAFTGPGRPLIAANPTYESPMAVAEAANRQVIRVGLTSAYAADVKKMVAEADKAGGGLIYFCNPNNPTSTVTSKPDVNWLIDNLPRNTVALIDEAYYHFSESPNLESAVRRVKEGRGVVVSRTFSKIYGMAGLRAGYVCARPDLIEKMTPFRNNVISIVTVHAVLAALENAPALLAERKAKYNRIRAGVCDFLKSKNVPYIDPHANFMMIDIKRDVRTFAGGLLAKGVAVGRPFPPMDGFLRVSIGSAEDMEKFKRVFWEVYSA
ncbi:MAG: aminotransferase class I/II-fold pyridoxal phosphate-dependent enzyme [Acidimicrobiia bacterium]|nr:aminotransferase class I/II-fold pyridoxal phosphate-dependent enzyme [Acidimicrobiia bacterium]